jgi:hypothetical protein
MMPGNDNGGEEAGISCEGFIAAIERNFKWQTWLSKDHFEKLFEATYPYHPYPVKHKLKDCTIIKKIQDVRESLKRQQAGRGPRREECSTQSRGSGSHDNLWLSSPRTRESYVAS